MVRSVVFCCVWAVVSFWGLAARALDDHRVVVKIDREVPITRAKDTRRAMMSLVHSGVADDDEPSDQGHAVVAIDVGQIMPAEHFHARMAAMSEEIKAADVAEGAAIYLPGELEWRHRERALAEGIPLPEDVLISLRGLAEDSGIDPADYGVNLG